LAKSTDSLLKKHAKGEIDGLTGFCGRANPENDQKIIIERYSGRQMPKYQAAEIPAPEVRGGDDNGLAVQVKITPAA